MQLLPFRLDYPAYHPLPPCSVLLLESSPMCLRPSPSKLPRCCSPTRRQREIEFNCHASIRIVHIFAGSAHRLGSQEDFLNPTVVLWFFDFLSLLLIDAAGMELRACLHYTTVPSSKLFEPSPLLLIDSGSASVSNFTTKRLRLDCSNPHRCRSPTLDLRASPILHCQLFVQFVRTITAVAY